jgi:type I restriction enzyme M protein
MGNEDNTRRLFETILKENGFIYNLKGERSKSDNCYLEGEKSENFKIQALLKNASKKGNGVGKPDFIISEIENCPDLLIICECKADVNKHKSINLENYSDYAVDGILLYSSFLSKEYNIISIAISGETRHENKISTFLQLKEEKNARDLNINKIYKFSDYVSLFNQDLIKEKQSYNNILEYAKNLNDKLHVLDIPHENRALLVSGILIALKNKAFTKNYINYQKPNELADALFNTISMELKNNNIKETKLINMENSYSFFKTNDKLAVSDIIASKPNTILRDLIKEIKNKVQDDFLQNFKYFDVLGKFYTEFLRYTNGDKSLGIVLTPQHITELFCDIANVNEDSVVIDNCCGTCGFLISAMKRMLALVDDNDSEKITSIYKNQLIGIESNPNMFALSCSNMMIRGDGKSNIYYGDCFEKIKEIKSQHLPNIGFLNPPYSKDKNKKGKNELDFVLNNLNLLKSGSICVAIVPVSCCFDNDTKKTRELILNNHTLKAVMSMNPELFINSDVGTVTCIMVFIAGIPHKQTNEPTWLADWKNDGFKKNKIFGRYEDENWFKTKENWLYNYRHRIIDMKSSLLINIDKDMEWCVEAYLNTDYTGLTAEIFKKNIKTYTSSLFINGFINSISLEPCGNEYIKIEKIKQDYFTLEDYFYIGGNANKEKISKSSMTKNDLLKFNIGEYPYIVTSSENNGVNGLYDDYAALGNCLTIDSATVGSCFYQARNFLYSDHVEKLYPKFKEFNKYIALYLTTVINLEQFRYSYGRKFNQARIKKTKIKLPIDKNGNPDWNFMQNYIKSLPYSSNI